VMSAPRAPLVSPTTTPKMDASRVPSWDQVLGPCDSNLVFFVFVWLIIITLILACLFFVLGLLCLCLLLMPLPVPL